MSFSQKYYSLSFLWWVILLLRLLTNIEQVVLRKCVRGLERKQIVRWYPLKKDLLETTWLAGDSHQKVPHMWTDRMYSELPMVLFNITFCILFCVLYKRSCKLLVAIANPLSTTCLLYIHSWLLTSCSFPVDYILDLALDIIIGNNNCTVGICHNL